MSNTDPQGESWPELVRATKTIVVVDVVESVRLMQADEADFIDRWRRFVHEVRSRILPAHSGRMVKSLGDGMLLEFDAVAAAVAAAMEIQAGITRYNAGRPAEAQLVLRLGGHVCEVVSDVDDVYGSGVNLAARLAALGGPGDITVSAELREQLLPGVDAEVVDLGLCHLRHWALPVHACRIARPDALKQVLMPLPDDKPRLAVLPFVCTNVDKTYGELIADGLVCMLGARVELDVLSRLSSSLVAQRLQDPREAAQALGATHLLCGRATLLGGQLRLFVELAAVEGNAVLWSEQFSGAEPDLFRPDSELLSAVARGLVAVFCAAQAERVLHHPLPTLPSYALQLGAISLMHQTSGQRFDEAAAVLEHLAQRHGRSVSPHVWLAKHAILRLTRGRSDEPQREAQLALEHTQRALALDPANALALATEGFVHCHLRRDLSTALQRLEAATQANPNEALAWLFKSMVLGFSGQGEPGWQAAMRAMRLSPLDPQRYYFESLAASVALAAGRYEEALTLSESSLRLNRRHSSTWRARAIALVQLQRIDEARACMDEHQILEPGFNLARYMARSPAQGSAFGDLLAESLRVAGAPRG